MTIPQPRKSRVPIGQLNGRWAMLLKVGLATYPILLAAGLTWATWVTASVMELNTFMRGGPRWTEKDAQIQTGVIQQWVDARIEAKVPPVAVVARLVALEAITRENATQVRHNALMLAKITTKMGIE
jgi:hypothetical protein